MLTQFIANPQGEAIYAGTLDCFTLRIRNDVRDNLNYTQTGADFACDRKVTYLCMFAWSMSYFK
jgi:hypothetical protein